MGQLTRRESAEPGRFASEILSKNLGSFITGLGTGAGEVPVRVFVGEVSNRMVGIAVAEQAARGRAAGSIVSSLIIH